MQERGLIPMPYILWMATAIPVIVAGGTLHFKMKEQSDKRWNILPKCLSTWMIVCTAALGVYLNGNKQSSVWILYAICFFLLADAFLEIHFFMGMAVFAIGHIWLICWLFAQGHLSLAILPVWLVGMIVTLVLFRKELSEGKKNPKIYFMILYPGVLMAMMAMAVLLPFTSGRKYIWAALGALLFSISDMMVGKSFFKKLPKKMGFWALALYYCGIFCLAMMTWAI